MKRTYKKLLAVLLAAILTLGLLPTYAFAQGTSEARLDEAPMPTGYIPGEIHGTQAVTNAYLRGEAFQLNGLNVSQPVRDLPSKYDSRNYNYVTGIRDQNPYGSCWAHAAMASVESYMIKFGVPVGTGAAATTSLNLSETQHCFFNYTSAYDAEGMTTGDKCTVTASGSKNGLDVGGNGEMSAYTLQHWTGVADESVSALSYSKASTVASSGLNSQYAYGSNVAHIQNSVWIPGTNVDAVKEAIMEHGAGNISYYEDNDYNSYICTIDTTSQESSSHKWANHAITVVGWDDTIATSKFSPNKPSKPGAWICKNSWGSSYFDSGYCYISYEDTTMNEGYIYFYDAEPIDNYAHNYQYDGTCNVVCFGKGWPSGQDYYVGFANNTKVANVFTAKGSELLRAVALCNWDEALTYTVEIYKNPTTGNPTSGTLMTSQSGTLTFSGYYTIPLDNPVSLAAGDTFSVVFTQSVPVADDSGTYVHTPYDATFNNTDVVSWANWTHVNHGNTSYYKEPNGSWTDCPDNGDYRIKAYTDDVSFAVSAESNNDAWGTVSVNGTKITAAPADGYYVESAEVISGTATFTINGNVINVVPSTDCTIRVIFAPKPTYTVNFVACGAAQGSQTAYVNDSITLPANISAPDGWTFTGWVVSQLDETTDAPAYYAPGASYTVTGNITLFALYSRVEEDTGSETVYQLLTAAPSNWAGNYVITNNATSTSSMYVFRNVTGSSSGTNIENADNAVVFGSSGITVTDDKFTNVANDYVVTLAANGSYYTVQGASTGTYYGMNSSSYLFGYSTINSTYCNWTPAINANGIVQLKNAANGSYPYFSWSTSNSYFWSGSSSNANVLKLWKETEISSDTTYYTTSPVVPHSHEMTHVPAAAPTCETAGNTEYWYCAGCGKFFSDAEGLNEIALEDIVIPATGHAWGEPTWSWSEDFASATATFTCANDATHVETFAATVTSETTEPAGGEDGRIVYTATVTGPDGVTYTDTRETVIPFPGPQITKQPTDQSGILGTFAAFTVEAEGEGLTYMWQSNVGGKWSNTSFAGSRTATLSVKVTQARDGRQYRCVITDAMGNTVTSEAATLTALPAIVITAQPADQSGILGTFATFTVEAEGEGLAYMWQSNVGGKWSNTSFAGSRTATLSVKATEARDGRQYRCVITDAYGNSVTTRPATLTVLPAIVITAQPTDVSGALNSFVTFAVEATGDGLTYMWQSNVGGKWSNTSFAGSRTATLTVKVTQARDGKQYRCVITDAMGNTVTSEAATLTIAD